MHPAAIDQAQSGKSGEHEPRLNISPDLIVVLVKENA